jgi:hypothetical protein
MHVGKEWMGAQMWSDDLIIATAHENWDDARDHMHHLVKVTTAWAAENGVTFCDDKSKVLIIGEPFAANTFRSSTDRPDISWTQWAIGKEVKSLKYLGVTINNKLTWSEHVQDIITLSKPKHRQVQPLAANPHVELDVVTRAREQKVPPCLLKGMAALQVPNASAWEDLDAANGGGAREVLNLQRFANGALACHELGWRPVKAGVLIQKGAYLWRLMHEAPDRTRWLYAEMRSALPLRGKAANRAATTL